MPKYYEHSEMVASKDAIRIRDILHGYITIEAEDESLLACPLIQRLRHIRQNDLGFLVFPNLSTSRFEHSLGVMHLAGRMAESAFNNVSDDVADQYLRELAATMPIGMRDQNQLRASFRRAARWYGLLHDVGHLPFSHATESAIKNAHGDGDGAVASLCGEEMKGFKEPHEATGSLLIKNDPPLQAALSKNKIAQYIVVELMMGKSMNPLLQPLKDIVDSEVDADRLDSTARDGKLSGGDFGHYDIDRLVQNARLHRLEVGTWKVMFTTRAIGPIEGLLMERYKTHRWIHFHPKVMALKGAFQLCVAKLVREDIDIFKWNRYYRPNEGFFDDAALLREMWNMKIDNDPLAKALEFARDSVLLRKETSFPLWKRSDEFRGICREIASADATGAWGDANGSSPIVNALVSEKKEKLFEERLNKPSATSVPDAHFLVTRSHINLVKWNEAAPNQRRNSSYQILIDSRKGSLAEFDSTHLSRESGLVQNFDRIPALEPSVSVCVLGGDKVRAQRDKLRDHFIAVAVAMRRAEEAK